MDLQRFFSPADREAIEAAVREVELTTAGEIVPFAVGRSDAYVAASWKGALSGALLFPGQGIKDLYAVDRGSPLSSDPLYSILANVILNY